MKIVARVTFEEPQNREFLIQAFYGTNYSPSNRLYILEDKSALIEISFEKEPPQILIEAISHCVIDAMYNQEEEAIEEQTETESAPETTGTLAEPVTGIMEENQDENVPEDEITNVGADDNPDKGESDATPKDEEENHQQETESATNVALKPEEEPSKKKVTKKEKVSDDKPRAKRRYGKQKPSEDDYLDIPELDTISIKVTNFNGFVTEVGKWLEMPEDDINYFVKLMAELSTLDVKPYEICTEDVKKANLNVSHRDHRRYQFGKLVTTLLEKRGIYATILLFICTVMKYAKQIEQVDDKTDGHEIADKTEVIEESVKPSEEAVNPEDFAEVSCYMNCESFVEILNGIDNDLPVTEKVKQLLSGMGLDKKNRIVYSNACQIVDAAFRMEAFESIDEVMTNAGFDCSTKKGLDAKVKFSEWINEYNKANHVKRMKVIAFLRELKTIFHT